MARSLVAALLLLSGWVAWAGGGASAATPSSASIGPSTPAVNWEGPVAEVSSYELAECEPPAGTCDLFELTVDVPPAYWDDHFGGVSIAIRWDTPDDYFQFQVRDETGSVVAVGNREAPRTEQTAAIPSASGKYVVEVVYYAVTHAGYSGSAGFLSEEGVTPPKGEGAFFDPSADVAFGPATLVSAHFLGAEPNVAIERPVPGSPPDAVDPDRVFVDWPLSTRSQSSQLSRSEDGGETFRLLFDPACAQRSRPNCATGGGGDTFTVVSPWDGTVYFTDQEGTSAGGQGLPLHEAVASSTDHGDSFPPERQFTTTNTAFVLDRQWLTTTNPSTTSVGPRAISAFLAYHVPGAAQYVQGIDESGAPIPQPGPQLTVVGQSGPLRVDNTGGPGDGWIYQPFTDEFFEVATAPVESYQDPGAWQVNKVTDDHGEKFPWFDLDDAGNAYALWVDGGAIYFSSSRIADPRNDPGAGGRPGTHWSRQLRVSLPSITSAYFGEIAGGGPGRVAITYMGTKDHEGSATTAPETARWNTYAATITNALGDGSPPVVHTGLVTPRVTHVGNIDGQPGGDVTLLDFIDVGVTAEGRTGVAFTDNNSTFAGATDPTPGTVRPFALYAEQVRGPTLFETDPGPVVVPMGAQGAALGDAKWPNASDGEVLPSLDLLGASLALSDGKLIARIPLGNGSIERMEQDLESFKSVPTTAPPAERLQYMLRFSNANDVYHLSAELVPDEPLRFFGGRLDTNDRFLNIGSDLTVAAGYKTDEGFDVTGRLENDTLVLEAPAEEFGVVPGERLFGVSAFSTAGPSEGDETLTDIMRTVDATPPFDAEPVDAASPTPTPPPSFPAPRDLHAFAFPEEAHRQVGELHETTLVVTDAGGEPVPGAAVEWASEGVGSITSSDERTDGEGRARAIVASENPGEQRVTVQVAGCGDIEGCSANVVVSWNAVGCDVTGTPASDVLKGTSADEVICGLKGNDKLVGRGGDDVLLGGPGSDTAKGGRGADALGGAGGRDRLNGGFGVDRVDGRTGRDHIVGGRGGDRLGGARGSDFLGAGRGRDVVRGGRGRDGLVGGKGRDHLDGGPGRDRLRGGPGRDRCRRGASAGTVRC